MKIIKQILNIFIFNHTGYFCYIRNASLKLFVLLAHRDLLVSEYILTWKKYHNLLATIKKS